MSTFLDTLRRYPPDLLGSLAPSAAALLYRLGLAPIRNPRPWEPEPPKPGTRKRREKDPKQDPEELGLLRPPMNAGSNSHSPQSHEISLLAKSVLPYEMHIGMDFSLPFPSDLPPGSSVSATVKYFDMDFQITEGVCAVIGKHYASIEYGEFTGSAVGVSSVCTYGLTVDINTVFVISGSYYSLEYRNSLYSLSGQLAAINVSLGAKVHVYNIESLEIKNSTLDGVEKEVGTYYAGLVGIQLECSARPLGVRVNPAVGGYISNKGEYIVTIEVAVGVRF